MMHKYIANTMSVLVVTCFLCFPTIGCIAQEKPSQSKSPGPGYHAFILTVGGLERSYALQVPASYDPETGSPLVVMFHGGGGTARAAMWETGWAEKAEKGGFLIVFPNAMPPNPSQPSSFARNPQLWNDGSDRFYPAQKAPDDVAFINAMLNDLLARFTVDARRIFATGFSNGASMSFRVGAELSKRIAAIAPVAGVCWLESLPLERAVPMCYITGKADPLNPIEGGVPKLATGTSEKVRSKPKPPVRDSILKWAKALGCPPAPASMSEANGVRTETYGPCHEGEEVVYITVDGLGHTWAGGKSLLPESMVGTTSDKIKATDVIWEFFQRHPVK